MNVQKHLHDLCMHILYNKQAIHRWSYVDLKTLSMRQTYTDYSYLGSSHSAVYIDPLDNLELYPYTIYTYQYIFQCIYQNYIICIYLLGMKKQKNS